MQPDDQIAARDFSLREFIDSPTGSDLLAAADFAFGRVDFGTAAGLLRNRLAAMPGIECADELALGELLDQITALKETVAKLNSFAVEFYRQSGGLALAVAAIKVFARNPTAYNRARLAEAAAPLAGYHIRMPPRTRRLLRPFIKGFFWRRELLSYGKLYQAVADHMKDGVLMG